MDLLNAGKTNRDCVSQPGEVLPVTAAGMTKLYYRPDYTNPETGGIYVIRGYERHYNNAAISGPSVDWFADIIK